MSGFYKTKGKRNYKQVLHSSWYSRFSGGYELIILFPLYMYTEVEQLSKWRTANDQSPISHVGVKSYT